jgi:hypothetical protein
VCCPCTAALRDDVFPLATGSALLPPVASQPMVVAVFVCTTRGGLSSFSCSAGCCGCARSWEEDGRALGRVYPFPLQARTSARHPHHTLPHTTVLAAHPDPNPKLCAQYTDKILSLATSGLDVRAWFCLTVLSVSSYFSSASCIRVWLVCFGWYALDCQLYVGPRRD